MRAPNTPRKPGTVVVVVKANARFMVSDIGRIG
jgi:hypothetical protein